MKFVKNFPYSHSLRIWPKNPEDIFTFFWLLLNYLRNYFKGHSVRWASCINAKPVIIMLSALNQEKYHMNQIDAWPSVHVQYLEILLMSQPQSLYFSY